MSSTPIGLMAALNVGAESVEVHFRTVREAGARAVHFAAGIAAIVSGSTRFLTLDPET
jgi:hypothetical protein